MKQESRTKLAERSFYVFWEVFGRTALAVLAFRKYGRSGFLQGFERRSGDSNEPLFLPPPIVFSIIQIFSFNRNRRQKEWHN